MTTRELIHEDEQTRIFEVRDDDGNVVGRDVESKVPTPPSVDDRLAEVEKRLNAAPTAADLEELKNQLGGR